MMRSIVFMILAGMLSACASQKPEVPVRAHYNTITHEEIEEALKKRPMQSAFELIEYLRPKYFLPRTQTTVNQGVIRREPVVYLNNIRLGGLAELENINILQIEAVHYLKSSEATGRFGMGHEGGAILISTR